MWAQQPNIIKGIAGLISPPEPPGESVRLPSSVGIQTPQTDFNGFNTEAYNFISDNPFIAVAVDPRATFSVDVDTASYANVRRFIRQGERPPKDSVRIEEMINYFHMNILNRPVSIRLPY
jgi:Ca-activated chloride channel family protein